MLGGQELQAGGSRSAPLTFIGGVNTSTDLVDGETLYDGQTGLDNGLLIEQSYTRASGFAFTRYSRAVRYQNGAHDNVLEYARAIGATDSGLYFFESNKNHVDRFIVSGASVGVEFEHASRNTVGLLQAAFQCGAGLRFVEGAQENSVLNAAIDDCFVGCQAFGTQNMLSDTLLSRCEVGYDIGYGINLARRISFSGCTTDVSPWSADPFRVARLQVEDYANGGENRSFEFGGEIVSLPTDRSGGSGRMWRTSFPTVFSVGRPFDHPVVLAVARVPLVADQPTTLNAYVRKSHATNVGAVLACRGGQIAGIPSDVTDEAAESTGWQVLSIKITASAQGVVEIELRSYRLASGAVGYVDIDQIERGT